MLVGNKRFFTSGTLETSEKSLDPCSNDSHRLSLLQGSSDFSLVSKVPQVKNRLFPTSICLSASQ